MFGFHKKLLRVNLTSRKTEVEDLDDELIRKYFGGVGLEAKILSEETGPDTDPLSPENILMAVTGPYTGTGVPSSGRHHVDWLNMITDWGIDTTAYMKVGERMFNLKRMYNIRLGVSRKDDFLPYRFLTLNRVGEGLANQLPPLGKLLSDYYAYRGWSEDGIPTAEKLAELGLESYGG